MLQKITFLIITLISVFGFACSNPFEKFSSVTNSHYDWKTGIEISTKSAVFINNNGYVVGAVDTNSVDVDEIIFDLKNSELNDKKLIVRVLEMQRTKLAKFNEIINLCFSYDAVAVIVLYHFDLDLQKKFTSKQIIKLKKRKK